MANGADDERRQPPANARPVRSGVTREDWQPPANATLRLPASPGLGEKATALAQGVNFGMQETGVPVGAMTAGARLGSRFGVQGTVAGALTGLAGGLAFGDILDTTLDIPPPEELPPALRPWAHAGEVIGAGAPLAAAPFAAMHSQTSIRFIDRILQGISAAPRRAATVEGASLVGSATGAGTAETLAPGNTGARVAAELAGGLLVPSPLATLGLDVGRDSVKRAATRFSAEGRRDAVAVQLRNLFEQVGEDPATVAKALREGDLPGLNRTAAQLTGSPTLQEIEKLLVQRSGSFGREQARRADDSLTAMRGMIAALEEAGDPQALREAAKVRERYFDSLLSTMVDDAEDSARAAVDKIGPVSAERMTQLGQRAETILSDALSKARAAERELWGQVDRSYTVGQEHVLAEAQRIRLNDLLPDEALPDLVQRFTTRLSRDDASAAKAGEMLIFRSRMLEEARTAAAAGNQRDARIYGRLAEAALDDLAPEAVAGARSADAAQGTAEDLVEQLTGDAIERAPRSAQVEGLAAARDFSRTLNDVFTRTFVGDAMGTTKTGASRIAPEVLMRRAVSGPRELTALRMAELERAVQMGSPEAAEELLGIMDSTLRYVASSVADPQTGLANPRQLARFRRDNAELLKRFPEIDEQLQSAQSANEFLKLAQGRAKTAQRAIERDAAFTRVAGAENPATEIARIMGGAASDTRIGQLARLAKQDGDAAVAGLRSAMLDEAFHKAGGDSGNFSFTAYRRTLEQPRRAGQPSAIQMMRKHGVMDPATERNLHRLLTEAEKVEQSMRATSNINEFMESTNALGDLVMRIVGSRAMAATGASEGVGGASIIMAGAGSRFARHVFNKVPLNRIEDVLIEAAQNPKFMATLLERPVKASDKLRLSRRINAWLWSTGLHEGPRVAADEEAPEPQPAE